MIKTTEFSNWIIELFINSLQNMSQNIPMVYDQYGQPFLILREQDKKKRLRGIEAQKVLLINFNFLVKYSCSNKYFKYFKEFSWAKRYGQDVG